VNQVSSDHAAEIIERWVQRQAEWSRLRIQVDGAALAAEVVVDLESLVRSRDLDALTLSAAAAVSGYSADHLSRLIRKGALLNVGRKGAPRIRRKDLPIRPQASVAAKGARDYDPNTDARFLRARR
jgi:hypothetical protein